MPRRSGICRSIAPSPPTFPCSRRFLGPFEAANFFGALARTSISRRPLYVRAEGQLQADRESGIRIHPRRCLRRRRPRAHHVRLVLEFVSPASTTCHRQSSFRATIPARATPASTSPTGCRSLRRWLTLYSDSLVHDDVSPVSAPRRSAINPGIYLTHFPGLAQARLPRRGCLHGSSHRRQHGRPLYLLGSRLPRRLSQRSLSDGQLDWPRRQRISGVEHLSSQPAEQHSGGRAQRKDRQRLHPRRQHAMGLERCRRCCASARISRSSPSCNTKPGGFRCWPQRGNPTSPARSSSPGGPPPPAYAARFTDRRRHLSHSSENSCLKILKT